jgi:hypothetical protein
VRALLDRPQPAAGTRHAGQTRLGTLRPAVLALCSPRRRCCAQTAVGRRAWI